MKRSICLLAVIYFIAAGISVSAQANNNHTNTSTRMIPGFERQALILNIESRVLEEKTVVWSEINRKVTMPGSPVGVQLIGSNIVVVVQFTPFTRRGNNVLAAQGQIWVADEENNVTYYTSIQTIPMEIGEPIYFFPLGSQQISPSIEIVITVSPYSEGGVSQGTTINQENDR